MADIDGIMGKLAPEQREVLLRTNDLGRAFLLGMLASSRIREGRYGSAREMAGQYGVGSEQMVVMLRED